MCKKHTRSRPCCWAILPDRRIRSSDFHRGAGRLISPLLTSLLHPLGLFLDLQLEISPELWGYTYLSSRACGAALSRIDLILGNRAAVGLAERVHVASGVLDVEHLPLLVDLRPLPLAIPWTAPRPRLPPLLQQAPSELRKSKDWAELVEQWQNTPAYRTFLALPTSSPAQEISSALSTALEALVDLAGGWKLRTTTPRPAYESTEIRRLRRSLRLLGEVRSLVNRELTTSPRIGSFSFPLQKLLAQLRGRHLAPPSCPRPVLLQWVDERIRALRVELSAVRSTLRRERDG